MRFKKLLWHEVGGQTNGSHLQGYLNGVHYYDLVALFGDCSWSSGVNDYDKVSREWIFQVEMEDKSITFVTIYDWKVYDIYWTENKLDTWNMGGFDPKAVEFVKRYILDTLKISVT